MTRPRSTPAKGKGKTGARRPAAPAPAAPRRGPSSSDLIGVVVLLLTASLAACAGGGWGGRRPAPTGTEAPSGELTLRFLDVGQGDAVLVRSPEGKTLLVDGGRSSERMRTLMDQYAVTKVDLMVASHADADHIAGLVPAAQAKPTVFVNNGLAGTTQTWERLVTALEKAGTTFQKANAQVFTLGSMKVRIFGPPRGMNDDQNNNSVGVRVEFGKFTALLTGDSEREETTAWLAQGRPEARGPVQIYKSIHHGARNGDHAAWLAAVRPENVVISVGENSYGHPTPEVLDLYRQNGIRVYRTDEQGTVTVTAQGDGTYHVTTDH